jgi:hypothetical protein
MREKQSVRYLPVGTEFEAQQRLDRNRHEDVATVYRYRVLGYLKEEKGRVVMVFEPVSRRLREIGDVWQDGEDMFGDAVMRCTVLGDPASPTQDELLATVGVETVKPNSWEEVEANRQILRRDRKAATAPEAATPTTFA